MYASSSKARGGGEAEMRGGELGENGRDREKQKEL